MYNVTDHSPFSTLVRSNCPPRHRGSARGGLFVAKGRVSDFAVLAAKLYACTVYRQRAMLLLPDSRNFLRLSEAGPLR